MRSDVPAAVRPAPPTQLAREGEWSLHLPFALASDAPSLNDREHWAVKARKVKQWRDAACLLARAAKIPPCRRILVELHYVPATNRRRDEDNLVATLKPLVDGLVDAHVVEDDTSEFVQRTMPVIHPTQPTLPTRGGSRFLLRVVALD